MNRNASDPLVIEMTPSFAPASSASNAEWAERASSLVLLAILIFAPLAFGTTEAWSQFIQRTVAVVLFGLWVIQQYRRDQISIFPSAISWPLLAFAALVLLQLVAGFTAYAYDSLSESLNLAVYAVFMLVAGELFTRRRKLHAFALAMGWFGALLAVLSIIQDLSGTSKILGLRSTNVISAAIYGPYVNHNHYAGLMEMLIPFTAAIAVMERGSKRALLFFATVIMVASVVFSRSRGGVLALAAELVLVCVVLFRMQRSRRGVLTVLGLSAAIAVFALLLGSDKVLDRLSETQDAYRFKIYRDCLIAATHKPVLGYGLGTFAEVYPPFRSFYGNTIVNHAHNDYLELLVETGIVGLGLFLWMLVSVFRHGFAKATHPDDAEGRLLTLAALAGVTGIAVHSLLDFNLHIPANAALFFVLCAAIATPFKHRIKPARFYVTPAGEEERGGEAFE